MGTHRVNRIRALLVDDHASFAEGVTHTLNAEPDFEVSYCTTLSAALETLQRQPQDIVLLDHDLGIERASQFLPVARQQGFGGRVLIVTAWVSDTEAKRLLRQGVAGIFVKDRSLEALAESIRAICGGEIWLDQRYRNLHADSGDAQSGSGLVFNERQRRVLR